MPEDLWKNKLNSIFDILYKKAIELGELVSGKHGMGFAKKDFLLKQHSEKYISLISLM